MFRLKFWIVVSFAAFLLTLIDLLDKVKGSPVLIGELKTCAHNVSGTVYAKTEREIEIRKFKYNGLAPAAWFHGQLKPAQEISTKDPNTFVTLPYPNDNCGRLTKGIAYDGSKDIQLILPRPITDFASFGITCYHFCTNFGHVVIQAGLTINKTDDNVLKPQGCNTMLAGKCDAIWNREINKNCFPPRQAVVTEPTPTKKETTKRSEAAHLTFTPKWILLFFLLVNLIK